jgi:hypothetical protein
MVPAVGVRYFCITGAGVPHPPGIDIFPTLCADRKHAMTGLLCRASVAYARFAMDPTLGPYLFRAMDDTIVNITNLLKLIDKLNAVYDPTTELVFRGYLNDDNLVYNKTFIGGGSGWLMSRPLVALHRRRRFCLEENVKRSWYWQDDTTETVIINGLFPRPSTWADPLWSERCLNCQGTKWRVGDFSMLPFCPRNSPTYSMNAIVSFHPGSNPEAEEAGLMIGRYPEQVKYFHEVGAGGITVCWDKNGGRQSYDPTIESIRAAALHITPDMLDG